jgi:hypothetical protein
MWWLVGFLIALSSVLFFLVLFLFLKWREEVDNHQTHAFEMQDELADIHRAQLKKDEGYRAQIREMAQRVIDADRFSRKIERFHKAIEAVQQEELKHAYFFLEKALDAASPKKLARIKLDADEVRDLVA